MAKKAKDENTENVGEVNPAAELQAAKNEKTNRPARPKGEYLASSGDQFKFSETETPDGGPVFIGEYTGRTWTRDKDKEVDGVMKLAGSVMGYYFLNAEGEEKIIGNSHAMEKAMLGNPSKKQDPVVEGDVLYIEFLGKRQVGPKSVNQFDIILVDGSEREQYGF